MLRALLACGKLASEQLSKQDHYDFGMRAVKSVLVMAGQLRRSNPELAVDITLIRALREELPEGRFEEIVEEIEMNIEAGIPQ